jgi:hypothetical protein
MVTTSPAERIPADLRDALDEALEALAGWTRNGPRPSRKPERKADADRAVFRLVEGFPEPAPEDIGYAAVTLASVFRSGREATGHACRGPKGGTYAARRASWRSLPLARTAIDARERGLSNQRDVSGGLPMARKVLLAAAFVVFASVALLGTTIGLLRRMRSQL